MTLLPTDLFRRNVIGLLVTTATLDDWGVCHYVTE